jgi:hypothetical protein
LSEADATEHESKPHPASVEAAVILDAICLREEFLRLEGMHKEPISVSAIPVRLALFRPFIDWRSTWLQRKAVRSSAKASGLLAFASVSIGLYTLAEWASYWHR